MAVSKVDLANQVENQLPQNLVANNLPFRNIIINGDMSIAQRGTSFSSISSGVDNYPVDRFRANIDTAGTWTISQDTDVPSGQGFATSLKMDCTTANGSLSAGSYLVIQHLVEAQNLQYLKFGTSSAESVTMSFWVKSNKTGTYIFEINSKDSSRAFSKAYTINSASTWEKKTITFTGDTTGVINNDNGSGFELNFWLAAGSTYSSGSLQTSWGTRTNANIAPGQVNLADNTANEWYITGVQLEAGTTASDFEFLPHDVNLERCSRYFYRHLSESTENAYLVVAMYTTTVAFGAYKFHKPMRASPTFSTSGTFSSVSNSSVINLSNLTAASISTSSTGLTATLSSARTGGQATLIRTTSDADAYMQFDAEL